MHRKSKTEEPIDFTATDRETRSLRFHNKMEAFAEASEIVLVIIALLAMLVIVFQTL